MLKRPVSEPGYFLFFPLQYRGGAAGKGGGRNRCRPPPCLVCPCLPVLRAFALDKVFFSNIRGRGGAVILPY